MSNYVAAQKLNRKVTIQRNDFTRDSWGQTVKVWVTVCRPWADILFQTGRAFANRESVAGGKEVTTGIGSVRIRWRTGIDAGMRLLIGGVPYDIVNAIRDERDHRFLDLVVVHGATNG